MNVLEKILKEIEERVNFRERLVKYEKRRGTVTDVCRNKGALEELDIVAEIIRSHMDEARDTNVPSNDGWIDRKNLKEEIKSLRFTINGMRNGKTMTNLALEEYRKSILKIIDEQPTYMDDGWISVEERLPNEREFQESYCRNHYAAEFLVTIEGATKPTTLYFKNNRWFDEERNYYKVIAWQPLPERCKGGDDRA